MTPSEMIVAAGKGWTRILGSKPDWRAYFSFDARALNLAFVLYFSAALLSIASLILGVGMLAPQTMIAMVAGYVLPVLALIISAGGARRLLNLSNPVTEFYVPGIMLLALMGFIGALTILVGFPLWGAILAITGLFLFRLARACGLEFAPAVAFGLFNFLAGLPHALYMMGGAFMVAA